jgi:hypothetical protein
MNGRDIRQVHFVYATRAIDLLKGIIEFYPTCGRERGHTLVMCTPQKEIDNLKNSLVLCVLINCI